MRYWKTHLLETWRSTYPKEVRDKFGSIYDFLIRDYFLPIYIKRKKTNIIYQMGKVGSISIYNSLKDYGVHPTHHRHLLQPRNIKMYNRYRKKISTVQSLKEHPLPKVKDRLYCRVIEEDRDARVITLVREPIARNISAFFQTVDLFQRKDLNSNFEICWEGNVIFRKRPKKLNNSDIKKFKEVFLEKFRHERPITWFDKEMKKSTGIDVYQYDFPKEKGYQTIREDPYELLILKLEMPDERMEKAIIDFLDLDDDFKLQRSNVGKKKEYAKLYQKFKENVELPQSYIDKMLNSKYTKHFYTEEEIQEAREKWS